jgi:hypothetical protein
MLNLRSKAALHLMHCATLWLCIHSHSTYFWYSTLPKLARLIIILLMECLAGVHIMVVLNHTRRPLMFTHMCLLVRATA